MNTQSAFHASVGAKPCGADDLYMESKAWCVGKGELRNKTIERFVAFMAGKRETSMSSV